MAARESTELALKRWDELERLQQEYPEFIDFMVDVMADLGFNVTWLQEDIAHFLQYGPLWLMVQAQRSQAKTTITACFVVWSLIHNPKLRALIVSAGGTQANEISTLIVRIIQTMPELECLRPDKTAGDRVSVEAFDVHHSLKGVDKSPSVACCGITSNLQGKRADLLIADDVESSKNSLTQLMREQLLHLTRDFPSICTFGRIIYLGTPQSADSIYNTLPGRGFSVRVWTGRYPTKEQMANYGDLLAPSLRARLVVTPGLAFGGGLAGDQGKPTDPDLLDEERLQKKEADQGAAYFQLQHMLNTRLSDAARYPLKVHNIIVAPLGNHDTKYPISVVRSLDQITFSVNGNSLAMAKLVSGADYAKLQGVMMYIDPAGGGKNGDETGYCVAGFLNGTIYVFECLGVRGGYDDEQMHELIAVAKKYGVNKIVIEQNFGYGAFKHAFLKVLRGKYECAVEDDYVTGQKERRIIDTLEPVISRGALVFNASMVEADQSSLMRYPLERRLSYSLFNQINRISYDRDCLGHDDRIDALEGAVRYWCQYIAIDQEKAVERLRQQELKAWLKDPMGKDRYGASPTGRGGGVTNRFNRRK